MSIKISRKEIKKDNKSCLLFGVEKKSEKREKLEVKDEKCKIEIKFGVSKGEKKSITLPKEKKGTNRWAISNKMGFNKNECH